eukprot:COSAG01_NODE_6250_length_3771_cov_3.280501_3_plen_152_part_00
MLAHLSVLLDAHRLLTVVCLAPARTFAGPIFVLPSPVLQLPRFPTCGPGARQVRQRASLAPSAFRRAVLTRAHRSSRAFLAEMTFCTRLSILDLWSAGMPRLAVLGVPPSAPTWCGCAGWSLRLRALLPPPPPRLSLPMEVRLPWEDEGVP